MRVPITAALPGLVLGAGLALAGVTLAPDTAATIDSTTTVAASGERVGPTWHDEHETVVGSSVIVLESLTVDDAEVLLVYEVLTIAPRAGGIVILDETGAGPGVGVTPETWVIETADGEYEASGRNTDVHEVRFEVDDQFTLSDVTGIRLTRYRMRMPYSYTVEVPPETGHVITIDDGYTISVDSVIPQTTSLVLHLGLEHPHDLFLSSDPDPVRVTGVGPEWLSATPRLPSGVALTREGPDVPDPLLLRVSSTYWITLDRPIDMNIGGLGLG